MRVAVIAALSGVLVAPGLGTAGQKSQSNLANPVALMAGALPALTGPVSPAVWTNGVSLGKTKGDDKCKVQVQMKLIAHPDTDLVPGTGDEVICIGDSHVSIFPGPATLSTSAVLRGEVKSGVMKIKVDLAAQGTGCSPAGDLAGPEIVSYNNRLVCYDADPAYPAPPLGFATDPTQGVYPASFAPRPASPIIAVDGIYFAP
jgi:hypothetical protein